MVKRKGTNYFFYSVFCVSLALTWFFHKDAKRYCDRNELWSDRAGYYIYLPATFFYHFDARTMPANLDVATGGGFSIDSRTNKLDTKYTYGVALMESPFFFAAGVVSWLAGVDDEHGFSMLYMRMMALAAVVYLVLGLWFLKKFLDFYFQPAVGFFVILLVFLGTNLFYYSLVDGMMSHVYSFFLFSLFLWLLKQYHDHESYSGFVLLCLVLSLALLIRPTNFMLGLLFFTWDAGTPGVCIQRVKQFLKPSYFTVFLVILFLIFLPQFVYWRYLSGHWLHFSYGGEGFANLGHPRILQVLFSPVNGLFAYAPLVLIFLAGLGLMLFQKIRNGWPVALLFCMVTLVCASWKMWYFGCSYGQRSFIEYYALLSVPFGYFTAWLFSLRRYAVTTILFFVIFLFTWFNLRYTISLYRYERCYYGSTWDWDHYIRSVSRAGILPGGDRIQSFENDFENLSLMPVSRPSQVYTRSGLYSIATREKDGSTPLFSSRLDDYGHPWPKMMEVEAWVLKPGRMATGASLSYTLNRGDEVIFGDERPLDRVLKSPGTWSEARASFIIPDVNDSSLQIRIFIRNPKHSLLFIDDLRVKYRYSWN